MVKLTLKVEFWEVISSPGLDCVTDVMTEVVGNWRRTRLRKVMKNFEDVARPTQGFGATAAAAAADHDGDDGFTTTKTCLLTLLCLHMNFWGGMKHHSIPSLVTTVKCRVTSFFAPKLKMALKGRRFNDATMIKAKLQITLIHFKTVDFT